MSISKSSSKSEHGGAIVIALAVLALVSVVSMAGFRYVDTYSRENNQGTQIILRDKLATKLRRLTKAPGVLYASVVDPHNVEFRNCLIDDSVFTGDTRPDCKANELKPVLLLEDEHGYLISGGTDKLTKGYNLDGSPCPSAEANPYNRVTVPGPTEPIPGDISTTGSGGSGSQQCDFQVFTQFSPDCGGESSCLITKNISMVITIVPAPHLGELRPMVVTQLAKISGYGAKSLFRPGEDVPLPPPLTPPPPPIAGDPSKPPPPLTPPEPPKPPPPTLYWSSCKPGYLSFNKACIKFTL